MSISGLYSRASNKRGEGYLVPEPSLQNDSEVVFKEMKFRAGRVQSRGRVTFIQHTTRADLDIKIDVWGEF